ncbi:hypothetical protein TNCV_1412261 [Trichonephila clavipes]|nr:hypothetical protein TNCV_1412261 [Trichonephila clavipes]
MTSSEQWRYVATEDNPTDFVSRVGMDSLKLKTCELWWNGPKFLQCKYRDLKNVLSSMFSTLLAETLVPIMVNLHFWMHGTEQGQPGNAGA